MKPHIDLCVVIRLPATTNAETLPRVLDATAVALSGIVRSAYLVKPPKTVTRWDRLLKALGFRVASIHEIYPQPGAVP